MFRNRFVLQSAAADMGAEGAGGGGTPDAGSEAAAAALGGEGSGGSGGGEAYELPDAWGGIEISPESKALVSDRKWASVDEALSSYRNAESRLGTPESRLLKLPSDRADKEAMSEIYNQLGRPESHEKYVFDEREVADGQIDLRPHLSPKLWEAGLAADQAIAVDRAFQESYDAALTESQVEMQAQESQELALLKSQWGPDFDSRMTEAGTAASALGMDQEMLTAYARSVGIEKAYGTLHAIHSKIGEHRAGAHSGGDTGGFLSQSEAANEIERLKADSEFAKAYLEGDAKANKRMSDLNRIANPGSFRT